ncbi:hypothetical protein HETIRDRAFT_453980 [Heterobasidion irregulare TC 32-1]|uniref:Uncharacterized protein n=1 Tax=Heterobasidion irregulare (strain TC 32-1) TaxID=747525 RepID=W4JWG2_HETIT|nr:uncharacterized protein HETIRDRAFT_453980 [Heterobasidion irregulare TC 32-1]ETW77887.1 hypothetical protein HETIRDRAFT_453980 [Heterobasidion irregulare TC 32-1]
MYLVMIVCMYARTLFPGSYLRGKAVRASTCEHWASASSFKLRVASRRARAALTARAITSRGLLPRRRRRRRRDSSSGNHPLRHPRHQVPVAQSNRNPAASPPTTSNEPAVLHHLDFVQCTLRHAAGTGARAAHSTSPPFDPTTSHGSTRVPSKPSKPQAHPRFEVFGLVQLRASV